MRRIKLLSLVLGLMLAGVVVSSALAHQPFGQDYPAPIIDHAWARERTLAAYAQAKDPGDGGPFRPGKDLG